VRVAAVLVTESTLQDATQRESQQKASLQMTSVKTQQKVKRPENRMSALHGGGVAMKSWQRRPAPFQGKQDALEQLHEVVSVQRKP
jgi:hypothetical protein